MIDTLLAEERFSFLSEEDKNFIRTFTDALENAGYTFGGKIGPGFCWGRYMILYTKANIKSKQVAARIYIREDGIALRLFLNDITKHTDYIKNAPSEIQKAFLGDAGNCGHCKNEKEGVCKFRKSYKIGEEKIEKCNGWTFTFEHPTLANLEDYLHLFYEFYPPRQKVSLE